MKGYLYRELVIKLAAQINRLLENHLKVKADYRRSEIASKRMLVKTEQKAQSVMELINQFFTLAKSEAGDIDIELLKVDICEICRESILDFYEI